MKYLLCKIGPTFTLLGVICAYLISCDSRTEAWLLPLFIVSCIFGNTRLDIRLQSVGYAYSADRLCLYEPDGCL